LDIWGRLANEYSASKQAVLAQEYEYLHIRDALATRVIQAWIKQVAIQRSRAIKKERVAVLQRIETVLIERYKSGIGNLDELSTAKSKTEIARADLSAGSADLLRSIQKLEGFIGTLSKRRNGIRHSSAKGTLLHPPTCRLPHYSILLIFRRLWRVWNQQEIKCGG
jgi:outer membrane protein TolC